VAAQQEINGSEVNSEGIFLLMKFSDQTKVKNTAGLWKANNKRTHQIVNR
jgi:hypothetical protein